MKPCSERNLATIWRKILPHPSHKAIEVIKQINHVYRGSCLPLIRSLFVYFI